MQCLGKTGFDRRTVGAFADLFDFLVLVHGEKSLEVNLNFSRKFTDEEAYFSTFMNN